MAVDCEETVFITFFLIMPGKLKITLTPFLSTMKKNIVLFLKDPSIGQ